MGAQRKWRSGLQIEEVGTNKVDKDKHYFFIKKRGLKWVSIALEILVALPLGCESKTRGGKDT